MLTSSSYRLIDLDCTPRALANTMNLCRSSTEQVEFGRRKLSDHKLNEKEIARIQGCPKGQHQVCSFFMADTGWQIVSF